MTEQNSAFLFRTFPTLFPENRSDPRVTLMYFGFETGDGWFELLKECFSRLVALNDGCQIAQVKEKFGALRIYAQASDEALGIISEYETLSQRVCEDCGQPGVLRSKSGWYRTTCDLHAEE